MKRTASLRGFAGFATFALVAGCTVDGTQLVATSQERKVRTPLPAAGPISLSDELPDELTCVSAPSAESGDVTRVNAWRNAEGAFDASVQRGPQFWRRSGVWFGENGEVLPEARQLAFAIDEGGALVAQDALGTVTVSLAREGHVFRGTLLDDQCYLRAEVELTCWSQTELFGSPWLGISGSLPARFDWAQNTCVNADGAPTKTRNRLPVDIIRETGNGECADLAGLSLNGDDFGYPDLDGWFLPGAKLDGARLFFASLNFATLDGADLSELEFGYATVNGTFNDETQLPEMEHGGACSVTESPWAGQSVTCTQ